MIHSNPEFKSVLAEIPEHNGWDRKVIRPQQTLKFTVGQEFPLPTKHTGNKPGRATVVSIHIEGDWVVVVAVGSESQMAQEYTRFGARYVVQLNTEAII